MRRERLDYPHIGQAIAGRRQRNHVNVIGARRVMRRDPLLHMTLVAPCDDAIDQMVAAASAQVVIAETHRLEVALIRRRVEVKAHECPHSRARLRRVVLQHHHLLREQ